MTLNEFISMLRREEASARGDLAKALADRPAGPTAVGKHEAKNWTHLRTVISEAQDACPRAAETIRWLLWHSVLDAQRIMMIAEDIEQEAPDAR
jgi:hypothetical protein